MKRGDPSVRPVGGALCEGSDCSVVLVNEWPLQLVEQVWPCPTSLCCAVPPAGALPRGPHVPGKTQGDCPAGAAAAAAGAGAAAAPGEAGAGTTAPTDPGEQETPGGAPQAVSGNLRIRRRVSDYVSATQPFRHAAS